MKASTFQASTIFIDVSMPKCKNMHAPHTCPREVKEHVALIWKNFNQSLNKNFNLCKLEFFELFISRAFLEA
jgi:hypothetical protein